MFIKPSLVRRSEYIALLSALYHLVHTMRFLSENIEHIVGKGENTSIFSSPEHEVLMVSYCDRAVSGVRRPSSVVRRPSSTFYLVYALEATVLVGYS